MRAVARAGGRRDADDLRREARRASHQATSRFVVIGDTGEGDASQHVLRDQLLAVADRPDVRFVVVSSDVVYPTGAMNDYEAKFWLPFKGVTVPVYAIPGNHDWYDALEGFAATFLQPDAARAAIRARVEADLRVTSTTDARIDEPDRAKPQRLRGEYGVPTGFQRGAVLRDPDRSLRADRGRHRHRQADRPSAGPGSRRRSGAPRGKFDRWPFSAIRSTPAATTWRLATRRSRGSSACCVDTASPS